MAVNATYSPLADAATLPIRQASFLRSIIQGTNVWAVLATLVIGAIFYDQGT